MPLRTTDDQDRSLDSLLGYFAAVKDKYLVSLQAAEIRVRVAFIEWTVHRKLRHSRLLEVLS